MPFRRNRAWAAFSFGARCARAGHHEDGAPLGRETLEAFVDDLAERGLVEKRTPGGFGRLLTDYEAHLTRRGRGLLEGAVSASPDILVGDL